ncbi:hypothetical protein [Nocardiopsis gilva]|uniref:hypothetical protein n=1 Tax=Nocardiopsis gilva TaxID=280236 RepID=UPI00034D6497|nr:hypothetical protein [Nocardiopsis gilva]
MGAVAVPAISDISEALKLQERAAKGSEAAQEELADALADMSPAARTLMRDWQGLTKEYRKWSRSLEPTVLPVFSKGIGLVSGNFKKLNPLVKASAGAFSDLIDDLDEALQHPFWSEFGKRVTRLAPTAIGSLGRTGGDIAAGVAGIVNAFIPSAPTMLSFVEKIAAGFAKWGRGLSGSRGFQAFMDYVRTTGPHVLDLLDSIGPALGTILRGLAPIAPAALKVATAFADLIAEAPPETITAIAVGITAVGVALKAASIASLLISISTPLGVVVTGLGLLAGGLLVAYQQSEDFRDAVSGAWSKAKSGWSDFWEKVGPGLTDLGSQLEDDFGPILEDFKAIAVDTWNGALDAFTDFKNGVSKGLKKNDKDVREVIAAYEELGAAFENLSGGRSLTESVLAVFAKQIRRFVIKPIRDAIDALAEFNKWVERTTGSGLLEFLGEGFVDLGVMIYRGLKFLFYKPGIGGLIWDMLMWIGDAFVWLYDKLVGNSVVPDLVNDVLKWFDKLSGGSIGKAIELAKGFVAWMSDMKSKALERAESLKDGVISDAVSLKNGALSALRDFRDGAIDAFDRAQAGIGRQWSKVQSAASSPVRFIVDTVYNSGIRAVWNAVAKKADLGTLPYVDYSSYSAKTRGRGSGYRGGLARGGIIAGTSAWQMGDDQLRPVRRGEGWAVSELMRDPFERARLLRLNSAAMRGRHALEQERAKLDLGIGGNPHTPTVTDPKQLGFARGGILGGVKSFVAKAKNQFLDSDFMKVAKGALTPMKGSVGTRYGRGGFSGAYNKLIGPMVSGALKKLKSVADIFSYGLAGFGSLKNVGAGLRRAANFVRKTVGRPYLWGGGGPLFDCSGYMAGIQKAIMNVNPPSHFGRLYSTFSFQGSRAPRGWVRGLNSKFMVGVTNSGKGHMAGTLLGVNVESAGSKGTVSGKRARGYRDPMFYGRYGFAPVARRRFGGGLRPYESAVVGEGGRELFTAGPTGGHVSPHRELQQRDHGGDHYVTINVNVPPTSDKAAVGRAVYEALVEYERRSGRKLARAA